MSSLQVLETIQEFSRRDFAVPDLQEVLRYFSELFPTMQSDWILFPTESTGDDFELVAFFKNENAVRKFKELAFACLGGRLLDGIRVKATSRDGRDQLVTKLHGLGYFKYTSFELPLHNQDTLKRLRRLRQVSQRSSVHDYSVSVVDRGDLAKFRSAIATRDFEIASSHLNALKIGGMLSSVNLCFLEFQFLFASGDDSLIWSDRRIDDVLRSSRPRVVTEFLLVSLWRNCVIGLNVPDLVEQNQLNVDRMRHLLKSVVMPTTAEGRLCLAVVSAASGYDGPPLFSSAEISDEERNLLDQIVVTKCFPAHLVGPQEVRISGDASVLSFDFEPGDFLTKAEQFRDEVDVNSLLRLLSLAHERGQFVEEILKKLVRCVADENLPDFAEKTTVWIKDLAVDTTSWSKGLKTAYQRVLTMASLYSAGWSGLVTLSKNEFATLLNVIVEAASSWSILDFEDEKFDSSFAKWLGETDPEIVQSAIGDLLLDRLQQAELGAATMKVIKSIGVEQTFSTPHSSNHDSGLVNVLIQSGESEVLEFKSSLRSPMQGESPTKDLRSALEFSCVKTVAAMLHNVSGGQLLIGISDSGECVGLEKDYESSEKIGGRDGFERHFRNVLQQKIDGLLPSEVKIQFETVVGRDVAIVSCPPCTAPRYVTHENKTYFFVRDGNATVDLATDVKRLFAFVSDRFSFST